IIQAATATISGNTATWSNVIDLSATGQNASNPQVALSADGTKATAVWSRSNGSNTIIETASATIAANLATWNSVIDLSTLGQNGSTPQIALSSDSSLATAVWSRSNGSNTIIQTVSATISGNTATWGSGTNLSVAGQDAILPALALSTDGTKASVIWQRSNGS